MSAFLTPVSPVMGGNETVSSTTLANSVLPGQMWGDVSGNQYIYVYNDGLQQISQGQIAVISANSGYSVTASSTTTLDVPIGIARNATIATAGYGWLMYRGFSGFQADANNSFATGDLIVVASNGNLANKTGITGFTAPVVGKVLKSVSSGAVTATNAAFLNFM